VAKAGILRAIAGAGPFLPLALILRTVHLEPARYHAERYKRTGEILPDSALEEFKKFDSIFLGAIGHPDVKPGILEVGILLKTRFALDQYINLRPVKLYPNVETPLKDKGPSDIDFVVVRENTGGIYTGIGGVTQKGTPLEVATQVMQYSRPVINRVGSRRALLGAYHRGKAWKPPRVPILTSREVRLRVHPPAQQQEEDAHPGGSC